MTFLRRRAGIRPILAALGLCLCVSFVPASLAVDWARVEYQDVLKRTPQPERGAELFRSCATCHAPDGGGVPDGSVPAIAGQHFRVIVKQLVDFRNDRRWDIRMEHYVDRHRLPGTQDLADVAAYVSRLRRTAPAGIGPGESVGLGASVYFRDCESCHGATGDGSDQKVIPRLAGQHYEYLLRQIYDAIDGRRPNMDGRHARLLSRYDRAEIVGVADYLSRMSPGLTVRRHDDQKAGRMAAAD